MALLGVPIDHVITAEQAGDWLPYAELPDLPSLPDLLLPTDKRTS